MNGFKVRKTPRLSRLRLRNANARSYTDDASSRVGPHVVLHPRARSAYRGFEARRRRRVVGQGRVAELGPAVQRARGGDLQGCAEERRWRRRRRLGRATRCNAGGRVIKGNAEILFPLDHLLFDHFFLFFPLLVNGFYIVVE